MQLWPQTITAAATLLASFLGFFLSGELQRRRDNRQAAHDKLLREEKLELQRSERRETFQLENLLLLADAIQTMGRLNVEEILHDERNALSDVFSTELPKGLNQKFYDNTLEVRRLQARILDDNIRMKVEELHAISSAIMESSTELRGLNDEMIRARTMDTLTNIITSFDKAQGIIGRKIRSLLQNYHPDTMYR